MKTRIELRAEIDAIDDRILELLNERAAIAVEIGLLKVQEGVPLVDPGRERTVINRMCAANSGPLHRRSIVRIFLSVIRESRRAQSVAARVSRPR